jgi:hypothetical protein
MLVSSQQNSGLDRVRGAVKCLKVSSYVGLCEQPCMHADESQTSHLYSHSQVLHPPGTCRPPVCMSIATGILGTTRL